MLTLKVNAFHERLLKEFSHTRVARGFNRGNGDTTPIMCREYLQFLEQNGCEFVTSSHVFQYRKFCEHLKTRKKFRGKGTISLVQQQHIRYSVHSFYEFLLESDYMEAIPVSGSLFHVPPGKEKTVLNQKEVHSLFIHALHPLERAILALAYGCGLRRAEIDRLRIDDYKPNTHLVYVREGKNYKSRVIPVSDVMNAILQDYLIEFRLKKQTESMKFLIDDLLQPVDGENAYKIIRRLAKQAQIKRKNVGLHILRNSIAVHMLNKGADIEFVKRFLGHTLLDTTMLYSTRRRKRISLTRRINAHRKYA